MSSLCHEVGTDERESEKENKPIQSDNSVAYTISNPLSLSLSSSPSHTVPPPLSSSLLGELEEGEIFGPVEVLRDRDGRVSQMDVDFDSSRVVTSSFGYQVF